MPPSYAENLRSKLANSKIAILSECAHTPTIEKPEEFVSFVTDFLSA